MKNSWRISGLCLAVAALSFTPSGRAQQNATAPQQGPAVRTTSEEVLLDAVVRDKKGHAIRDLKPEDFHVFDNGEEKKITSFRLVQGSEAIAAGGARMQLDPLRQIRLVTLIFQAWNNDARRLARDGALDLLKGELPQNVYVSVMTIDHKLQVLQSFTNDPLLIRKAIERATHAQGADYSADTARVQKELENMLGPKTSGEQSSEQQLAQQSATLTSQAPAGHGADGSGFANLAMAQMVLSMIQTERDTAMQESGRADIYGLLDCVKEQYRLPGRKTILYFREGGFPVPQGMEEQFKSVISIANRSNVSFYTVDARGLITSNMNTGVRDALASAASTTQSQATDTGSEGSVLKEAERSKAVDTAIESTRSNTQTTLLDLATSTGGLLIANTNDFRGPLRKLEEDIVTYYEITYSPGITTYDGSFRKIAIKMNSNDLRVQSRSGYIALPPGLSAQGMVLRSYEVPLLTALSSAELPKAFGYQSVPMHFRGAQNQSVCDLVLDVPLGNLTFHKNATDQSEGRLSYVALVKNGSGEVIKKFGNEIPMKVPEAERDALASRHFIYTEHFDLPAGHYTVETAVLDGEGNRISARKNSLIMPTPSAALSISSVSIVRSMKNKDAATDQADPLLIGNRLVSPTLNPTIKKAGNSGISFYVVIYPNKNTVQPPRLSMEFSRNGQVLGSGSPEVGQPDKDGRIQYVATVPVTSLEPGDYSIRFSVLQGTETAEERTTFVLQ